MGPDQLLDLSKKLSMGYPDLFKSKSLDSSKGKSQADATGEELDYKEFLKLDERSQIEAIPEFFLRQELELEPALRTISHPSCELKKLQLRPNQKLTCG